MLAMTVVRSTSQRLTQRHRHQAGSYKDWVQAKKNPTQETLGGTQSIRQRDQPLKQPESSGPLLPMQLHDPPLAGKSRRC